MRCSLALLVIIVFNSACSDYMTSEGRFFSLFSDRRYTEAAQQIKEKSEKDGKDQVLYKLDRGLSLFEAGNYKDAVDEFLSAERLSEFKDYVSIHEELGSLITTDRYKKFKPLDFERIMMNIYLAVGYLMLDKPEDALVECRKINNLIYVLRTKGLKDYQEIPLAWYLSALIYESQDKYNDAYVDYKNTKRVFPSFIDIGNDLLRMAGRLNMSYDISDLKKEYPDATPEKGRCPNCGEVVVIYSSGFSPVKRQDRHEAMLPAFYTRGGDAGYLSVKDSFGNELGYSNELLNIEALAIRDLNEKIGIMRAKNILGLGVKAAVGYGVYKATNNENLGILTGLLLASASTPDLRSWSTLPKSMQVARIHIPAGNHELTLMPRYGDRDYIPGSVKKTVKVEEGESSFLVFRN